MITDDLHFTGAPTSCYIIAQQAALERLLGAMLQQENVVLGLDYGHSYAEHGVMEYKGTFVLHSNMPVYMFISNF